jgi:hypothetical protein
MKKENKQEKERMKKNKGTQLRKYVVYLRTYELVEFYYLDWCSWHIHYSCVAYCIVIN